MNKLRYFENKNSALTAKSIPVLPTDSDSGFIEGYGAVWGNVDLGGEIMQRGCFARSLITNLPTGKLKLMAVHYFHGGDAKDCVGTITQAHEDDYGLWIHAVLSSAEAAQDIRRKVLEGHVKGLSVGYILGTNSTRAPQNSDEEAILEMVGRTDILVHTECELLEVTLTVQPMNPRAVVTDGKSLKPLKGSVMTTHHENLFIELFNGKTKFHDNARAVFQPKSKALSGNSLSATGVSLPRRFAHAIMPEFGRLYRGKSAGIITSTDPSGASLHQDALKDSLFMYEGDDARIFPRALHIPTGAAGGVQWPTLVQSLPGDEDAADEFAEQGGARCEWSAEATKPSDAEPKLRQTRIDAWPLAAFTELSVFLCRISTPSVEQMLRNIFRASMLAKIDRAIINGNGVSQPLGILQTPGLNSIAREVPADISDNDLIEMEHTISPMLRNRAIWVLADNAVKALKKKVDGQNRPLYPELRGSSPKLRGAPVVSTRMTKLGNTGDALFIVPDQYVCALEEEFVLLFNDFTKMHEGVRQFYAFMSLGGRVANPTAFTKLV